MKKRNFYIPIFFIVLSFFSIKNPVQIYAETKIGAGIGTPYGGDVGMNIEYLDKDVVNGKLGINLGVGGVGVVTIDRRDIEIGWNIGLKYYFRRKSFDPFIAYKFGLFNYGLLSKDYSPLMISGGFSWKFFKSLAFDFEIGAAYLKKSRGYDSNYTSLFAGLGFSYEV